MKYMLLMYASEVVWTDSAREACFVECAQIADQLSTRGQYLEGKIPPIRHCGDQRPGAQRKAAANRRPFCRNA